MTQEEDKVVWQDRKRWTFFGLPLYFTKYSLTKNRLFISSGLLTSIYDEVRLYRITDVSVKRTLFQKIFGLGSIFCKSSDKTLGDFEIKNIKKVLEVNKQLSELVEEERKKHIESIRETLYDVDNHDVP